MAKLPDELRAFLRWTNTPVPAFDGAELVQEQESALQISDADSDVLFASEREPLTEAEYAALKAQVLRSAADFLTLYRSAPDENVSCLPVRQTFLRARAAHRERNVRAYQKRERLLFRGNRRRRRLRRHDLRMPAERLRGAGAARRLPAPSRQGRKLRRRWSLRKVLRRFLWHDRIHAKAMYRMLRSTFADAEIPNPFCF